MFDDVVRPGEFVVSSEVVEAKTHGPNEVVVAAHPLPRVRWDGRWARMNRHPRLILA